jgi:hypothetical protein
MVRYFYTWVPLVFVGAIFMLALPWLALVALPVFALVALAALAAVIGAVIYVPYMLGRAISRRWHTHAAASTRTAILSPAERRDASRA